jgi:hypothetical protein
VKLWQIALPLPLRLVHALAPHAAAQAAASAVDPRDLTNAVSFAAR